MFKELGEFIDETIKKTGLVIKQSTSDKDDVEEIEWGVIPEEIVIALSDKQSDEDSSGCINTDEDNKEN